ncbi:MAG: hypothetical protein KAV87_14125 [Desulfobacteraceae bacterium]|nr:hypothetical protein [Desulfobacteraceae bacterium]
MDADLVFKNIDKIIAGVTSLTTIIFGWLTYKRSNKIKKLEEEKDYLRKRIHRTTSKLNPETHRLLIKEAKRSVQIFGINALGPIYHCREEIIDFLRKRDSILQIILLDPTGDIFREQEVLEEDSIRRIYAEWKATLYILKDIELYSGGSIELKLHTEMPDRFLLIIDALNDFDHCSKMIINYYPSKSGVRGYMGGQFLSEFILERDRDSFNKNIDYFQKMWEKAVRRDIDDFIFNNE